MTATVSSSTASPVIAWPLLPDNYILPDDPVENEAQPRLAAALTNALSSQRALIENALIVSNFALCASIDGNIICKAPDWMYIAPIKPVNRIRRSYTPHREGVVPPVVMEFLSESDCGEYSVQETRTLGKWYYYEQIIKVPTYVIFDPASGELEVYTLQAGAYEKAAPDAQNRYPINGLGSLRLGVCEGTRYNDPGFWLRWWAESGELLLWSEEKAQAAESKAQAAENRAQKAEAENVALLAKLKAAGLE